MLTNRSHGPLYLPLLIAVCGVLFSIWNAQDSASVPCISAGCTLYQSFTINGFSLWWGGVGIFTLLGLLALTGHAALGRWLSGLAVLLDCVLLGIMVLTLPCMACMAAAVLLALSYAAFRSAVASTETRRGTLRRISPLLALWGLLFVLNIGGLVRSEIQPWAVQSPAAEDEGVARVFFSPSCSACRQLVMGMSEADARKVIWCPVADEENDLAVILNLNQRIGMGTPLNRAFLPSLETPPLTVWDMLHPDVLLTQFRLWCNAARVITASDGQLPLVEFMGVPSALIKAKAPSAAPARPAAPSAPAEPLFGGQSMLPGAAPQDHGLPFDMGTTGSCGGPNAVPCP